jgi:hypothetical protein
MSIQPSFIGPTAKRRHDFNHFCVESEIDVPTGRLVRGRPAAHSVTLRNRGFRQLEVSFDSTCDHGGVVSYGCGKVWSPPPVLLDEMELKTGVSEHKFAGESLTAAPNPSNAAVVREQIRLVAWRRSPAKPHRQFHFPTIGIGIEVVQD